MCVMENVVSRRLLLETCAVVLVWCGALDPEQAEVNKSRSNLFPSLPPSSFKVPCLAQSKVGCQMLAPAAWLPPPDDHELEVAKLLVGFHRPCKVCVCCVSAHALGVHWVQPRCRYQTVTAAYCFSFRPVNLQFHHWAALFFSFPPSSSRNGGDLMLGSPVPQLALCSPTFQCCGSRSQLRWAAEKRGEGRKTVHLSQQRPERDGEDGAIPAVRCEPSHELSGYSEGIGFAV